MSLLIFGINIFFQNSLEKRNFEKFSEEFEKLAQEAHTEDIVSVVKIDKEITLNDISKKNVEDLKVLEPYGESNKTPVFIYKNLKIDSIRALSEGKHLKLTLKDGGSIIDGIGFNIGGLVDEYLIGDKVDVLAGLELNSYGGIDTVQLNIKDIRKSY